VLVFTMPFWTLLLAWPALGERVRGAQWAAIGLAAAGLVLVVAPWDWRGDLTPKLWAVASGFGWAAGTVATKHFQRQRNLDMHNFMAWQMFVGVLPLTVLPLLVDYPPTQWSVLQGFLLLHVGAISTACGFLLWIAVLRWLPAGTASLSMFAIPVIALVSSMIIFGERLLPTEWSGIALIAGGLAIIARLAWLGARTATATTPPLEGG
jgi:drug/metabolite transporter (DMT)-like permease